MKTKALLIITIFTLTITFGYAKDPQLTLQQEINSHIKFPESAIEKQIEGAVFVEFTVKKDGQIEVLNCFSMQGELQSYIFQELSTIKVDPDEDLVGKNFLMRFDFKFV